MDFEQILFNRRSIRSYLDKPVEREKLDKVLKAATYAPSAMNNQARQFIAITDKEILKNQYTQFYFSLYPISEGHFSLCQILTFCNTYKHFTYTLSQIQYYCNKKTPATN